MKSKTFWIRIFVILIGLLFLFSAVSKLLPIYAFEFLFVRENIFGWVIAPFAARMIISIEFIIGIQLCMLSNLKRISIPSAVLLLAAFSVYLSYSLITQGISANCGCFGELLPMSTSSALIKNLVMTGILIYAYMKNKSEQKANYMLPVISAIASFALVFIIFPVKPYIVPQKQNAQFNFIDSVKSNVQQAAKKTDTASGKTNAKKIVDTAEKSETKKSFLQNYKPAVSVFAGYNQFSGKKINPDVGEKIITVFSLDCEHCMAAAKEIALYKQKFQLPQILTLFFGEESQVPEFFKESGLTMPYTIIDAAHFFPFLKKSPPRISYLVNGNIIAEWEGDEFSVKKMTDVIDKTRER